MGTTPAPEVVRPAVIDRFRRIEAEIAEYERQIERCRRNITEDFIPYLTAAEKEVLGQ